MGYFAGRAAPLGQVGPSVVSAVFFNFHESMVRRSIPEAWGHAGCPAILRARRTAAATALRRILPTVEERAVELVPLCRRVVESADGSGRTLFSANRDLEEPDEPVEALWQGCTSLREHRGDGHVVALTAAGLDGCEALVLFSASEDVPAPMFRESRGWSSDEWEDARHRLDTRGLMEGDRISAAGAELRRSIEELTDELAAPPLTTLTRQELETLEAGLRSVAAAVLASGEIPFPNPIGLPPAPV
ncbi:MAG: hypothetical protein ABSC41_17910 [Acidimicrobiales bacterium]|jgi:hypothetical protein